MNRILFSLAVSLFVLTDPLSAGGSVAWKRLRFRSTDGQTVLVQPAQYTVLCFLGTECPLARLYGPRLQKIADEFEKDDVAFLGINSNVQDSPAEIDSFARKHAITFSMVKDADQSIADTLGATRTPEVFVVDADGNILYQGRIDDQYEPGISRSKPTKNDLREAIKSLVDGQTIETPKTQGVGCLITRMTRTKGDDASQSSVTFTRDIAPILNANCVECHRKGEIGPMELSDYDEVVGWGQMILEVIDQGRMPPWHADPDVGHFVGERRMDPLSREKIANWIDEGMPEGDPEDLPNPPTWPKEWQFPNDPDDEIVMRDRPFTVPAEGVVEYQYFVVDPKWTEDHWVRAAQVVPGNASVVHHVIVFVRPPDGDRFQGVGWLAAYVPGQLSVSLPDGHARRVPAGSKLVFQMHYTPNGREADDRTRVGIWSIDPDEVTHEVFTQVAIDHQFEIPPKASQHVVDMSVGSFPPNSRMLGITPHMHLRGKSFELNAVGPNGNSNTLLSVPRYDFNWQHWYQFANSVDLAAIDRLEMTVTFDNSSANPFNPAPQDYVSWGDQTWEEMALAFFDVAIPRGGPLRKAREIREPTESEVVSRNRRIDALAHAFLTKMDKDKDGIVLRDETPVTFRRFGFNRIDQNRDGRIDLDEIRLNAAERL